MYNTTYTLATNYEFGNIIATTGDVILNSGIQAYFIAEEKIIFNPGFKANPGSYLSAKTEDIYVKCFNPNTIIYNSSDLLFDYPDISMRSSAEISENNNKIIVYPNPTSGEFSLQSTGISHILNVEVIDLSGNTILKKDPVNQKSTNIDINFFPSVIYVIKVATKDKIYTKRIIKI